MWSQAYIRRYCTQIQSLDIFTIWMLVLLAIGFAAVNPKNLKGSTSYIIAFSVWGALAAVKVLWAFVTS